MRNHRSEIAVPVAHELRPAPDPVEVFQRLSAREHCLFLDSAVRDRQLGRYSFVGCDPFEFLTFTAGESRHFQRLEQHMANMRAEHLHDLPPFQGGAAGLFGYDLCRDLENVPSPRFDEFTVPAMAIGFYDVIVAFDHWEDRAWIISTGLPETEHSPRQQRADQRLQLMKRWLETDATSTMHPQRVSLPPVAMAQLAPQFAVDGPVGLTSNFSADDYRTAVERAVEFIRAGDVFQVNLSQRLLYPATGDAVSLYRRLRERNPATFAGYFDLGEFQIVSASPERFVKVLDGDVEARPIKGTRHRAAHPVADLFMGDGLKQSEKDRAENVMIVDLLRNDLSRVCQPDSVQVTQLCELEVYAFVQHLVSAVRGKLRAGKTPLDLIRAAFPGGSITGAPKVRAMQIISELEPTARGPYCGSLGYVGFNGAMDLSILIRTITAGRGWWQLPVGGGIVAQSSPQLEYEETWHKATGMIRSLEL